MAERVVSIKLQAEATGLVQGFARARDAAGELKARVGESARSQREEWAKVGTGLAAVGAATTGIGVAALKTGIQYNTLQQTTRAALSTLLGSAQAANAQMDKLDAFARNSPFSKATFINAQQQMLAFGIEAKKVVPYLDAVQNAVAAAGGSNADIEGIVATMSKIQSSAKITAEDLNEFGGRGVNAAELIGSQMGKTGAQIREDISSGSIDATQALDALAKGMSTTFEGAAANVKDTFAGSLDRVKAAWRDFSAELARPLVDPNGGGMLVDLLNWTADAMRNFQALPEPVKNTASAVTGLAGAGTLALGSAMLLIPKWLEMVDAAKQLGITSDRTSAAVGKMIPAALALGLAAASAQLVDSISDFREAKVAADDLERSLRKTTDISQDLTRGFSSSNPFAGLTDGAMLAESNLRQLNTGIGQIRANFESTFLGKALTVSQLGFGRDLGQAKEQIEELDAALAASVAAGRTEEAAAGYQQFAAMAKNAGWEQEKITAMLPQYAAAQEDANFSTQEATESTATLATQYADAAGKTADLTDQMMELLSVVSELNGIGQTAEQTNSALQDSYADLQDYVANAQAGVEGYSTSLDEWTQTGAANRAMLADHAADVEKNAQAQFELEKKTLGVDQATANFQTRMETGRQQIYDTALALTGNAEQAQLLTDKLLAMPDQKAIDVLLNGTEAAEQIIQNLTRTRQVHIQIATDAINSTVDTLTSLGEGRAYGGTVGYASGGTIGGIGGGVLNGTVFGRGTDTSDSVLVRLSRGEEVIRASQARQHRGLLKQINAGELSSGLTRGSFVPSAITQQAVVERVHTETPTSLTVVDANGALIGTMQVVANREIDGYAQQVAQAQREAG